MSESSEIIGKLQRQSDLVPYPAGYLTAMSDAELQNESNAIVMQLHDADESIREIAEIKKVSWFEERDRRHLIEKIKAYEALLLSVHRLPELERDGSGDEHCRAVVDAMEALQTWSSVTGIDP